MGISSRTCAGLALLLMTATAACGGGGGSADRRQAAGSAAPVGTGFTSDQLRQALLLDVGGYQRAGEPDSGEYGSLKAIRNFDQLQSQVKRDKPQCANAARGGFGEAQRNVPAALVTFAKGGQTVTEVLMAVSVETAEEQVRVRVPANCRTFRAKVGDLWSTHQIVEAGSSGVGRGSRTVGVATTSGESHVKTWYVVLQGRGYLATVTLYGPNASQQEAELLARQAHDQAERILPR